MSDVIPDGWIVDNIGNLSTKVGSGVTPRGGSKAYSPTGVKFIRSQNVHYSGLKLNDVVFISEAIHASMNSSQLSDGDVLLNITGASIGRCTFVPEGFGDANVNQHVCIIRPNEKVTTRYLSQWFSSDYGKDSIELYQAGGNREGLNFQQIRSMSVRTPPLPEQQKIAAILSSVDEVIEKTQAQIEKLKDLKIGMMQELLSPREPKASDQTSAQASKTNGLHHSEFKDSPLGRIPVGWEALPLNIVCRLQGGYAFQSRDATESGCRWLKIANVGKGEVKWDTNSFLPNNFKAIHNAFMLSAGDIVVALTRPVLSGELKTAKLTNQDVPALLNQRVARAIPNTEKVTNDFLYNLFSWKRLAEEIETTIFGTDPPNVSTTQIGSLVYPIPPISQQIKISKSINSVIEREQLIMKKYSALKNAKKALMQDLLTGKVRVQVNAA